MGSLRNDRMGIEPGIDNGHGNRFQLGSIIEGRSGANSCNGIEQLDVLVGFVRITSNYYFGIAAVDVEAARCGPRDGTGEGG